jgi:protein O-GlcNAc transferase
VQGSQVEQFTPPMNDVETLYQMAVKEHQAGRIAAAEALYRQILDRNRLFARAWYLLGVALHQQGDSATAIEYVERAIGLEPQWPLFYGNLGSIYAAVGRMHDAERVLRQGLAISPRFAMALGSLGHVLNEQNRCDEAIELFRQAIELTPQEATHFVGLGYAHSELGQVAESIAAYRRASELSNVPLYRILAATQLPLVYSSSDDIVRWRQRLTDEIDALLAEGLQADLTDRPAAAVFSLPHQGFNDLAIQRKLAQLYRPPSLPKGLWQPRADEKIRVGFVSSFFSQHTIGKLARGLIQRLSRAEFHVTLFSVGEHDDAVARELTESVDRYVLVPRHLEYARRAILADSVDALIFTDIGMNQTTYSLAFSRLAPVQCTTWGHPETTGLETIDYFLSSSLMETPEADAHYSERLVRLPSLTFYFYRSQLPPQLVDRAAFGLHPTARLYACPQSIYKFHPDFDATLAGILRRDPEGQVVLIRWAYPQADALLQQRFAKSMPDVADRIVFIRRLQQPEFMNFLTLIDVMLDPFPYGGGNSSLEAFSFGVPVVTLPTGLLRGRITQALCRRLGIESCIARDLENYVTIATRLGTDLVFRGQIRQQILAGQSRLFEDDAAVHDLERFLRQVATGPGREPNQA